MLEKSQYVLNSNDKEFYPKLKQLIKQLKPTYLLDAVAGDLTGNIFNLMPRKSTAMVYGALSL